jgi:hypothetical protein
MRSAGATIKYLGKHLSQIMTDRTTKTLKERFIEVSDQDINLKFLFDHLRNYIICGAVIFAAAQLMFGEKTISGIPYFGIVSGFILFIISYVFFWLNIFQGMHAASVCLKLKPTGSPRIFISFVAIGALLTMVFIELLLINFSQTPNSQTHPSSESAQKAAQSGEFKR